MRSDSQAVHLEACPIPIGLPTPGEAAAAAARLRGQKIAFVLPSLDRGGAERQAFLLAKHLMRHEGARVVLVGLSGGALREACDRARMPYTVFRLLHPGHGPFYKLVDLVRFTAFLRGEGVDVLLPYCMFPNVLCALTWKLGGVRLCVWNQRDEGRDRVAPLIERAAVRRIRHYVSNSQHGAEFLHSVLHVPSAAIQIVHNGVELSPGQQSGDEWRRLLGIDAKAFVGCMVGNLHRHKDHATLVAAWPRVIERLSAGGRKAHLLLAGAFRDTYEALADQVRRLGLEPFVRFLGQVGDIPGLLRAADLAVFSSQAEGLPNAVLEAMAAGLAVAATDYPGVREALGPSGTCLLARPGDAADLADKILAAALDPELCATLSAQGRRRIETEFTTTRMGRRMADGIVRGLRS